MLEDVESILAITHLRFELFSLKISILDFLKSPGVTRCPDWEIGLLWKWFLGYFFSHMAFFFLFSYRNFAREYVIRDIIRFVWLVLSSHTITCLFHNNDGSVSMIRTS